jgi:periplasmic protein TonB
MKPHRLFAFAVMLVACIVQPAVLRCQNDVAKDSSKTEKVYHVGRDGVTPPRSLYAPNPEFDEAARRAKLNGFVVLSLIVTPEGNTKDIRVTKSLSPGLDQRSIEAVSKWKFAPATKDGKPVAVELHVQTTFNIY